MNFTHPAHREMIFHSGNEPERIDFMNKVQELNFDDAFAQRQLLTITDHQVPILYLNDLIANKLPANRLKDQAGVEHLLRKQKSRKPET
jgi:hypothetical protein